MTHTLYYEHDTNRPFYFATRNGNLVWENDDLVKVYPDEIPHVVVILDLPYNVCPFPLNQAPTSLSEETIQGVMVGRRRKIVESWIANKAALGTVTGTQIPIAYYALLQCCRFMWVEMVDVIAERLFPEKDFDYILHNVGWCSNNDVVVLRYVVQQFKGAMAGFCEETSGLYLSVRGPHLCTRYPGEIIEAIYAVTEPFAERVRRGEPLMHDQQIRRRYGRISANIRWMLSRLDGLDSGLDQLLRETKIRDCEVTLGLGHHSELFGLVNSYDRDDELVYRVIEKIGNRLKCKEFRELCEGYRGYRGRSPKGQTQSGFYRRVMMMPTISTSRKIIFTIAYIGDYCGGCI